MAILEQVLSCVNSLGVMALLGFAYGTIMRRGWHPSVSRAALGTLFGLGGLAGMAQPIAVAEGVFVDLRVLFVGSSTAFLGPLGGAITVAMVIAGRFAMGGAGVVVGITSITGAAIMGLVWSRITHGKDRIDLRWLLALGLMLSLALAFAAIVVSPVSPDGVNPLRQAIFIIAGFNLMGTAILGGFIERERQSSEREARLADEASTDALTGLLNRRSLEHRFTAISTGALSAGQAILILDLDHFKSINDTFGHAVGDQILRMVADALRRNVRSSDLIARLGGEEFVVVLCDTDPTVARSTAERIRAEVAALQPPGDVPNVRVTISVGGHFAAGQLTLTAGLKLADAALYRAKASGRNNVTFSRPGVLAA